MAESPPEQGRTSLHPGSLESPQSRPPTGAVRSGIFTLHGAQGAIRNQPNARQCCNPPQSA
eukprot:13991546-Alexandrium_andersonii.AAC.1